MQTLDLSALARLGDENDVVRAFAANSAFRAADWDELTTETNPYRRPVRPGDLEWLDFSQPTTVDDILMLSGLLGHRMLRNIYDADYLYLPPEPSEANSANAAEFYSVRSRVLAEAAKPVLENHVFSLLAAQRPALARPEVDALTDQVREHYRRRAAEQPEFARVARQTRGKKEAATFVLLQWSAFRPATHLATARAALGEYDVAHPRLRRILLEDYQVWVAASELYRNLLHSAELVPTVGAYWQLYLSSSLGRGNYLHHLSADGRNAFALLGALVHEKIDRAANAAHFAEVFGGGFGYTGEFFTPEAAFGEQDAVQLAEELVTPLHKVFGRTAVEEFHRGFCDARWLADLWDRDLATQLDWADRIPEYQDKADKIDQHLTNENIEVDLDTFVESNEETSTTHVHDEHRLVMIEAGQMHFWNNVTHKIELNEGDKLLIPVSRLHGSTVLSGSCTYHQPIIPEEMLQQFT